MKNHLLLILCFLLTALGALGQKNATDSLYAGPPVRFSKSLEPTRTIASASDAPRINNLVSQSSFKRAFQKDFSTLAGNNNLPVNQLIVSLNKPEILVGQLIDVVNPKLSIPLISFYPYIKGNLNDDDEFRLTKDSKIHPSIGLGGKVVIIPAGLKSGTGYFFNSADSATRLFIDKNNLLKKKIKEKYKVSEIQKRILKLEGEINDIDTQLNENNLLSRYLKSPRAFAFSTIGDTLLLLKEVSTGEKLTFDRIKIEGTTNQKLNKAGRVDKVESVSDGFRVTYRSNLQTVLTPADLIGDTTSLNTSLTNLREKRLAKVEQYIAEKELLKKRVAVLKELEEDAVYEIEKEAPWTLRRFYWFTLEGSTGNQSANLFRNGVIEEELQFRKNVAGASANFAYFRKGLVVTLVGKLDWLMTNNFFNDDPLTFVRDSLYSGSVYKTSTSTEAYDVSKLSDTQFDKVDPKALVTVGATLLWGTDKKKGINLNYQRKQDTKVVNLKMGLIIPVILDNSKAEQSNVILEMVLPDLNSQIAKNAGKSTWQRKYFNLKVGIPINLL